MSALNITSLSSKGQIVIPNSIRQHLHLETGTKLTIISDGNNILLRPIEKPEISEFQSLIDESQNLMKDNGFRQKNLKDIIKQVRDESSH